MPVWKDYVPLFNFLDLFPTKILVLYQFLIDLKTEGKNKQINRYIKINNLLG